MSIKNLPLAKNHPNSVNRVAGVQRLENGTKEEVLFPLNPYQGPQRGNGLKSIEVGDPEPPLTQGEVSKYPVNYTDTDNPLSPTVAGYFSVYCAKDGENGKDGHNGLQLIVGNGPPVQPPPNPQDPYSYVDAESLKENWYNWNIQAQSWGQPSGTLRGIQGLPGKSASISEEVIVDNSNPSQPATASLSAPNSDNVQTLTLYNIKGLQGETGEQGVGIESITAGNAYEVDLQGGLYYVAKLDDNGGMYIPAKADLQEGMIIEASSESGFEKPPNEPSPQYIPPTIQDGARFFVGDDNSLVPILASSKDYSIKEISGKIEGTSLNISIVQNGVKAPITGNIDLSSFATKVAQLADGYQIGDPRVFLTSEIPDAYLVLDGSTFDSNIFPALAKKLGTNQLKDLRNRVLRGAGSLIALGEVQEDAMQNVSGSLWNIGTDGHYQGGNGCFSVNTSSSSLKQGTAEAINALAIDFDMSQDPGVRTTNGYNAETRVKAFGVNICIKAQDVSVADMMNEAKKNVNLAVTEDVTFTPKGYARSSGYIMLYNYAPDTKEFLYSGENWIHRGQSIPADSTLIAVPAKIAGYVWCFDGTAWNKVEDHRNQTVYDEKTAMPLKIKDLGPIPAGYTLLVPPQPTKPNEVVLWDGEKWEIVERPSPNIVTGVH